MMRTMISITLAVPRTHEVKCACCSNKATWYAGFSDHHYRGRLPPDGLYRFSELPSCWWCLRTVGYMALKMGMEGPGLDWWRVEKAWGKDGIPPGARPSDERRKVALSYKNNPCGFSAPSNWDRYLMPIFWWEQHTQAVLRGMDKAIATLCCFSD